MGLWLTTLTFNHLYLPWSATGGDFSIVIVSRVRGSHGQSELTCHPSHQAGSRTRTQHLWPALQAVPVTVTLLPLPLVIPALQSLASSLPLTQSYPPISLTAWLMLGALSVVPESYYEATTYIEHIITLRIGLLCSQYSELEITLPMHCNFTPCQRTFGQTK